MFNIANLSRGEEKIMKILWESKDGDLDLATVNARVKHKYDKDYKLQTVATFLTRLQRKGFIEIYRVGRYSHYRPLISAENYKIMKLTEMLNMWFDGDTNAFHAALDEL